jgi:hypothetical protein
MDLEKGIWRSSVNRIGNDVACETSLALLDDTLYFYMIWY